MGKDGGSELKLNLSPCAVNSMADSTCYVCGSKVPLDRHHIVPREHGGEMSPLVDICRECHTKVHSIAAGSCESKNPRILLLAGYVQRSAEATKKSTRKARTLNLRLPYGSAQKLDVLAAMLGKTKKGIICAALDLLHGKALRKLQAREKADEK